MQRDLVIRAQGGDHQAFTALVAVSVDRLFNVARLILRNNELAEDAAQEALLRAGAGIGRLRDPDRFDAWIQQLLVRACYRSAKQERGRRAMDLGHYSIGGASGRPAGSSSRAMTSSSVDSGGFTPTSEPCSWSTTFSSFATTTPRTSWDFAEGRSNHA